MTEIYALSDPRSGAIRYIGKAKDSRKRFAGHMREARLKGRNFPVYSWIASLLNAGVEPELKTLCIIEDSMWQETERKAITVYRAHGHQLKNLASGGDEPYCSPEQRSANARKVNAKLTKEQRQKCAATMNAKKPKWLSRLYRHIEADIRFFKRRDAVEHAAVIEKTSNALAILKQTANRHRESGSLAEFDEIIRLRFFQWLDRPRTAPRQLTLFARS